MLLINTGIDQTINIGDTYILQILKIDINSKTIKYHLRPMNEESDSGIYASLKTNFNCSLAPKVKMTSIRILRKDGLRVILGFDAPREIIIYGNWEHRGKKPLPKLSDKELVDVGEKIGMSTLEKELTIRLKNLIS